MRQRIAIDGLVLSAVDGEIGLTVAIQIQLAQGDAALDRLLENSGNHVHSMPGDFARKSDIERDDFHRISGFDEGDGDHDSEGYPPCRNARCFDSAESVAREMILVHSG